MRIDDLIPEPDTRTAQSLVVDAGASATAAAIRTADLASTPLARALTGVAMVPERVAARVAGRPQPLTGSAVLADLLVDESPWTLLADDDDGVVLGLLWTPPAGGTKRPAAEFADFAEPGFVKVAWSLSVAPYGPGRSILVTETRAAATDESARCRFLALWRVIAPFAGLARREVLRTIRAEAEGADHPTPAPAPASAPPAGAGPREIEILLTEPGNYGRG